MAIGMSVIPAARQERQVAVPLSKMTSEQLRNPYDLIYAAGGCQLLRLDGVEWQRLNGVACKFGGSLIFCKRLELQLVYGS